ncbi:hypothetical protein DAPPUDRAFT_240014 [Daphnia pulex]|uniref:DUF7044 domain-containing protein n=1 Tax=Daphnia pulex TaxID=6669 RepID=E9GAP0_DAPPU|nr:hypothetical protein DAPPUDRAFT_240014 [Daphnia pulex]|eukprot:EFX83288.1 hypothetical protein DAPPUDRAFT_240014 [Daphnia pulex]
MAPLSSGQHRQQEKGGPKFLLSSSGGPYPMRVMVMKVSKRSSCQLPDAWRGTWFQSGLNTVRINETTIDFKGKCLESDGEYYLFEEKGLFEGEKKNLFLIKGPGVKLLAPIKSTTVHFLSCIDLFLHSGLSPLSTLLVPNNTRKSASTPPKSSRLWQMDRLDA